MSEVEVVITPQGRGSKQVVNVPVVMVGRVKTLLYAFGDISEDEGVLCASLFRGERASEIANALRRDIRRESRRDLSSLLAAA